MAKKKKRKYTGADMSSAWNDGYNEGADTVRDAFLMVLAAAGSKGMAVMLAEIKPPAEED